MLKFVKNGSLYYKSRLQINVIYLIKLRYCIVLLRQGVK